MTFHNYVPKSLVKRVVVFKYKHTVTSHLGTLITCASTQLQHIEWYAIIFPGNKQQLAFQLSPDLLNSFSKCADSYFIL